MSTEALMNEWLADPDPVKRAHAAAWLAMKAGEVPVPPSLFTKAVSFAGAVASHVSAGMPTLDGKASEARLAVCRSCPRFLAPNTCAVCGCSLSFKASWADQHCPEGRWPGDPVSPRGDIGPSELG